MFFLLDFWNNRHHLHHRYILATFLRSQILSKWCRIDARKESDFGKFAPVLKEIVDLKREIVAVTHPHLGTEYFYSSHSILRIKFILCEKEEDDQRGVPFNTDRFFPFVTFLLWILLTVTFNNQQYRFKVFRSILFSPSSILSFSRFNELLMLRIQLDTRLLTVKIVHLFLLHSTIWCECGCIWKGNENCKIEWYIYYS